MSEKHRCVSGSGGSATPAVLVVTYKKIFRFFKMSPLLRWFVANCLLLVGFDLPIIRPPDFTTDYLRQIVWSVHFNPAFLSASAATVSVHAWPLKMAERFWRVAAHADVSACLRNVWWAPCPWASCSENTKDSSTNTLLVPSSMGGPAEQESPQEPRSSFLPHLQSLD